MGECFIQQGYTAGVPAGEARFTVSGTWTSPFNGYVSLFLVNGGNGGGKGYIETGTSGGYTYFGHGGHGGCGGNTKTFINVPVNKNETYEIAVGRGGDGGNSDLLWRRAIGGFGGLSCFSDVYGVNVYCPNEQTENYCGSRGGYGAQNRYSPHDNGENGKVDGEGGQGTTTKEFGNYYGTLYSGGGGGGGLRSYNNLVYPAGYGGNRGGGNGGENGLYVGLDGTANTGGGGGGGGVTANTDYDNFLTARGGNGGSGIVVIKWHANGARTIEV